MLNQDTVREATRFTQAGQLTEATSLLQRMLRGDALLDRRPPRRPHPFRVEPPTIDLEANDVEETEIRPPERAPPLLPTQKPRAVRPRQGLLRARLAGSSGTRRLQRPISCPRAQSSSKAPTATRREAERTSYSSRAAIRGSRFRWSSCFTAAPSRRTISPPAPG